MPWASAQRSLTSGIERVTFELGEQNAGLYFVEATAEGYHRVQRLVIAR